METYFKRTAGTTLGSDRIGHDTIPRQLRGGCSAAWLSDPLRVEQRPRPSDQYLCKIMVITTTLAEQRIQRLFSLRDEGMIELGNHYRYSTKKTLAYSFNTSTLTPRKSSPCPSGRYFA